MSFKRITIELIGIVMPSVVGVVLGLLLFDGLHENMDTWKAVVLSMYLGSLVRHIVIHNGKEGKEEFLRGIK